MRAHAVAAALTLFACSTAFADHPLGGLGLGTAGPITTISAGTLPKGKFAAAYQIEHLAFKEFSDAQLDAFGAQGLEVHSLKSTTIQSLRLAWGVTDDLTVGVKLPYVNRKNLREVHVHEDGDPPELHVLGDSKGLGDVTLLGQYRFMKGGATEAAALLGIKAPTGKTDRTNALGETFEAEHLPGSGSWDGLLGAALTHRIGAASIDANLLYTIAGDGTQDTRLGDRLAYNLGLSYRIAGGAHDHAPGTAGHAHLSWDLILELNGERQEKVEVAGVRDPNSGGNVLYASPGLRLSGEGWSAFASWGKPIVKSLHGVQHDPDYRVVAGIAIGF
jgi:hypothetical protein